MSEPRDFAREIGQATVAGDVAALNTLCIELMQKIGAYADLEQRNATRKARQAERKRRQREIVPETERDLTGHGVTERDSLSPLVPPSPLPGPNPSSPFNPPSPKHVSADRPARNRVEYTPDFEAFWEAYPRDGRVEKQKAFKAYRTRLRDGHSAEVILAGLERYKRHLATSGRYPKNPATFVGPEAPFLETWELTAVRGVPGENAQQRAERVEAERKLRLERVTARRQSRDGDEWWQQINREATERGLTKAGEIYDYAYKQLAS